MLASERFFIDFGDPLLLDSREDLMWSAEYMGGGGGTAGVSYGDFSFNFQLPSAGSSPQPDARVTLTQIANAGERALEANLGAWQQGQITADDALSAAWRILDDAMARMMKYGPQGYQSAAERDRRIDPTRLRWDWIAYYIDPIYMAETGSPAPVGAGGTLGAPAPVGAGLGIGGNNMIWIAAIVLVAVVLLRRSR